MAYTPKFEETEDIPSNYVPRFEDTAPQNTKFLPKVGQAIDTTASTAKNVGGGVLGGLKDTALGIGSGATMGFGDEIAAGIEAGVGALQGDDFFEKYRQYQKENEAMFEQAKERSPWLYGAGELVGGVGSTLAMPIGGLAKGASIGAKIGLGALEGGVAGTLYGAGTSKETLDNPLQLAEDAASSGLIGGITGGIATPVMSKLGSKASELIASQNKKSPLFRQLVTLPIESGIERGRGNTDAPKYGSYNYWRDVGQKIPKEESSNLMGQIEGAKSHIQQQYGDVLERGKQLGVSWDSPSLLQSPETVRFLNAVKEFKPAVYESDPIIAKIANGNPIDPLEMQKMKELSSNLFNEINNKTTVYTPNTNYQDDFLNFNKFSKNELVDKLKSNSGVSVYDLVNKRYGDVNDLMSNVINAKHPDQLLPEYADKLSESQKLRFGDTITDYLKHARGSEAIHTNTQIAGDTLVDTISDIGAKEKSISEGIKLGSQPLGLDLGAYKGAFDPESFTKNVLPAGELKRTIRDTSDLYQSLARNRGMTVQGGALTGPKGLLGETLSFGAKHGQTNLYKVGKIAGWSDDALRGVADKLENTKIMAPAGKVLRTALDNKNTALKNATLFSLLQKPEFRSMFQEDETIAE
jgi:hypothetical protein